jgi:soluble lytic murein transglycosylase-like protein
MQEAAWQDEVARLLEQAAQFLRDKADRRAARAFGTAIAYLQLARENGDRLAAALLAETVENAKQEPTERFSFQPGELEALTSSPFSSEGESPTESERPSRLKKK